MKKNTVRDDLLEIDGIVAEAAMLVDRELSKDNVTLEIEVAPDLPSIRGDRVQLQQVLVNLMVNAGQAMAKQAGVRVVTLRARLVETGILAVTVQDTGPGVAPDDLPRLFEPLFTTKQGGMGMGLAICRTTVEAHGGQLSAESPPGPGAIFRLTLPVIRDQGAQ